MKRTLLLSIAASIASLASADYNGAGYYRVHNYKSERYASVVDNRGRIDYMNTTADLQAIKLQKDFDAVCCDPASVLYISGKGGTQYQIEAEGTGIYQIISHYLNLKETGTAKGQKLYNAYGEMNGVIKYIGDANFILTKDLGTMATHAKGDYIKWFLTPVSSSTDNYFGIKPTVEIDGKYYATLYAHFPFTPVSKGMKVYYVKNRANGGDTGLVLLEEVKGTVPAGTPVLIECSTDNPSTNRVEVGGNGTAVAGNMLKGVYFNCSLFNHVNRKAYDKKSMRVLGRLADGSLGFVTPDDLDYIPANSCYLIVQGWEPEEFKIASPAEFEAGVGELPATGSSDADSVDVYNLQGMKVLSNASKSEIANLPKGIYIANGKKFTVR